MVLGVLPSGLEPIGRQLGASCRCDEPSDIHIVWQRHSICFPRVVILGCHHLSPAACGLPSASHRVAPTLP